MTFVSRSLQRSGPLLEKVIDLDKLEDSNHLLEILLQVEDVLDSLDIYVFRHWFDGEVVEGPDVKRHQVSVTLLYPDKKMPDPRATLRLLKHGVTVEYNRARRAGDEVKKLDGRGETDTPQPDDMFWMVKVSVPRRLLADIGPDADDEEYEEENDVDVEDAKAGEDQGLTDTSAYDADEQAEVTPGAGEQPPGPPGAPPGPQPGAPR